MALRIPFLTSSKSPLANENSLVEEDARARSSLQQLMCVGSIALLCMTLGGWIAWQYPFTDALDRSGTPIGGDFPMFYLSGKAVWEHRTADLYNLQANHHDLHQLFPGLASQSVLPYRYPPFVAMLLSPLAALPYGAALLVWIVFQIGCGIAAYAIARRELGILRSEWKQSLLIMSLGFPLVWEAILGGQASLLAVLIVVASEVLLRKKQWFWAGVVLGLAAYKPPVLLFVGLAQVIRVPRILVGITASVLLLITASVGVCGWQTLKDYINVTLQLSGTGPWNVPTPMEKVHGLVEIANWFSPRLGKWCVVLSGFAASIGVATWLRRTSQDEQAKQDWQSTQACADLGLALLLLIQLTANPYLPIYDLVLLLPVIWFGGNALWSTWGNPSAAGIRWLGPVLMALVMGAHLSQAICPPGTPKPFSLFLLGLALWLAGVCHFWGRMKKGFDPNQEQSLLKVR